MCGADIQAISLGVTVRGSPPRVRSRLSSPMRWRSRSGITSACAEQTVSTFPYAPPCWDHLRVCGADFPFSLESAPGTGSPPRVRSRLARSQVERMVIRITSACAEQTLRKTGMTRFGRDHLRVCGADRHALPYRQPETGSPPRVRSRHHERRDRQNRGRITSACAEQTLRAITRLKWTWDHLRVCGADGVVGWWLLAVGGSPPRVRSRHIPSRYRNLKKRITSACAEQTQSRHPTRIPWRDHLRVCGADCLSMFIWVAEGGSPPRVRSRLALGHVQVGHGGITSACAEQTLSFFHNRSILWDHLRVCGADMSSSPNSGIGWGITSACAEQTTAGDGDRNPYPDHLRVCGADPEAPGMASANWGSPPRVRSRPPLLPSPLWTAWITSACAEQTIQGA